MLQLVQRVGSVMRPCSISEVLLKEQTMQRKKASRISGLEEGDVRVPRPIDDERRADHGFLRDKAPEPAVKTVVAVVAHAEDVIALDVVGACFPAVDPDATVDEFRAVPFAADEGLPPGEGSSS